MIVITNYRYENSYGTRANGARANGSGIFDTVLSLARKFGPTLLKSAASSAASEAGKQLIAKLAVQPQSTFIQAQPSITQAQAAQQKALEILNKYKSAQAHGAAIDIRDYVRRTHQGSGIKTI